MFVLNETQRLAITAGCVGFLLVIIVITLCIVCPVCWINRRLNKRKSKITAVKKNSSKKFYGGVVNNGNSFMNREPPPPYQPHDETEMTSCSSFFNFNKKLTPTNSTSSASDSITGIPLPFGDDIEFNIPEFPPSVEGGNGHVSVDLLYSRLDDREEAMGHFKIVIKEGIKLPLGLYGSPCDPYIVVELFKVKNRRKTIKSDTPILCSFKTPIARKTQNPVYNETYVIPFFQDDLQKCTIKLTVWDCDRLANDSSIGECMLVLRDLNLQNGQEITQTLELKETKQNNGQLLMGLCYLPTAERMTVAILKANNLKSLDKNEQSAAYVQAMAIYGGRVLERRKTSCRPGTALPIFNEMLMFDVPYAKLEHVVLLVVVRNSSDNSTLEKSSPRKDPFVGKVAIGGSCCTRSGSNHWNAMKNSPRRQIIQWHILQ